MLIEKNNSVTPFMMADYKKRWRIDLLGAMVNDATFGTPSAGVNAFFTTAFAPDIIRQILPVLASDRIAPPMQVGTDWTATDIAYRKVDIRGETAPYADDSMEGQAEANSGFVDRQVYQYQEMVSWGSLEIDRLARVGYNWLAEKRNAAAYVLAQKRNAIFFEGVPGKRTYGIINDPNLNPVVVFPASASNPASSKWMYKTFTEIVHDIQILFNSIVAAAGGNVTLDQNLKMYLVVAPEDLIWLTTPNSLGFTALDWILRTFPNIEIVTAPQYKIGDGTQGNYAQLVLDNIAGQPVVRNLYSYLYMSHGIVQHQCGTAWNEKISAGSAGAAITQPIGIATGKGA